MPVILVNNAASIEVDISAALKYTINKGAFDVVLESTGLDSGMVIIILRSHAITERFIKLDWRDISSPTVVSAEALRDLLLSWNIPLTIIQSSALPDGAATAANQTNGSQIVHNYELAVARGLVSGVSSVNKFGAAPDGIQTTPTDVWSRANSTPTQQIWLAPTAARIHSIVSTSTDDDGSPVGTGARTIRIYGLKTWDLAETYEDIILNGTTPVNTVNSYVIIHRMKVLTCGASGPNVGTISATAAAPDSTVTAVILPGDGQTEMAIYGVPSIQSFYLTRWSAAVAKATAVAAHVVFELRVNENPNVNTTCFLRKNDLAVQSTGSNNVEKIFINPPKYAGPCIIKVQGTASAADIDAKSGFDGYLVTN
jgi:hypothetical protein